MAKVEFQVKEVSDQIQQNHDAWATTIDAYPTNEEAEKAAQKHWEKLCDEADQSGSNYVGKSVYVREVKI
jgi:hypothetical protein